MSTIFNIFKIFKPYPTRYYENTLALEINVGMTNRDADFEPCFKVDNVKLPPGGHFGVSAATGALAGTVPPNTGPPNTGPPNTGPPNTAPPNTAPPNTAPPNTAPSNTAPPNTAPPNTAPPNTTSLLIQHLCHICMFALSARSPAVSRPPDWLDSDHV